jgi:hypothetical protein
LKREISYLENLNANEETTDNNLINFALIFWKGKTLFEIVFAYYNISLPKKKKTADLPIIKYLRCHITQGAWLGDTRLEIKNLTRPKITMPVFGNK